MNSSASPLGRAPPRLVTTNLECPATLTSLSFAARSSGLAGTIPQAPQSRSSHRSYVRYTPHSSPHALRTKRSCSTSLLPDAQFAGGGSSRGAFWRRRAVPFWMATRHTSGPAEYGGIAGVPVYLSMKIPSNVVSGTHETRIFCADFTDIRLLEDNRRRFGAVAG